MMDLLQWLPFLYLIGFIIFGGGYLFVQWKLGAKGVSSEVIATYKEQVAQLKEELIAETTGREQDRHDLKNEIQALGIKVATMQGQMLEKDKKLQEFTAIFQGKDPELKQILQEIRDFMKKLSEQSQTNQTRNETIDKDTSEKKGNVMTHEVKK